MRKLSLPLISIIFALFFFEWIDIDLAIQDLFFNPLTDQWLVPHYDFWLRGIFYNGMKYAIAVFGGLLFINIIYNVTRFKKVDKGAVLIVLALAIIPSFIASLRDITNTYCPDQIVRYGGSYPYVKPFEAYPKDFHQTNKGKCFPAAHASGGFALIGLYYGWRGRKKVLGLAIAMSSGWIMGIYQMLKGDHYLSHTVITMLIAWLIAVGLEKILDKTANRWPSYFC
jgi:membrane-associated PAP2 superfamily phosphatase